MRKYSIVGWQDNYFCYIFGASLAFHIDLLGKTRDDRLIAFAAYSFNPSSYIKEEIIFRIGANVTYVI